MQDTPGTVAAPAARIGQLRTAELLVLAAARLWVADYLDPHRHGPNWRDGFRAAGLDRASGDQFDALFAVLAAGAIREICFHRPTCACLGADEALLLRVFFELQRGRAEAAARLLAAVLAPAAVRLALLPAGRVAMAMAGAGIFLPCRANANIEKQFVTLDHGLKEIH